MDAQPDTVPAPDFADERPLEFTFTGTAREYFGIWIVNLLLSIITIGIYTAWAKVRRLRYFYGNTWLDGHNFEYHANPKSILIGRIIVVGALVAYNVLATINPLFALILIPYLLALPWLINKSMAFNARMTSYRNVRFNFRGSYWGAMGVFVGMPILAMLTLGIMAPIASQMSQNYIGRHTGYGTARFATDALIGRLYANLGMTALFVVIASLIFGVIGSVIGGGAEMAGFISGQEADAEFSDILLGAASVGAIIGIYVAAILAFLFYGAGVRNVAFNNTELDGRHRLQSSLSRFRYVWILVSNIFATLLTVGLLRPWAAIRTWRYLAASTGLVAVGTLDAFVDEAAPEGNVGAAEFFDIEGIDFGL